MPKKTIDVDKLTSMLLDKAKEEQELAKSCPDKYLGYVHTTAGITIMNIRGCIIQAYKEE